jgi:hypothetical protein
VGTGTSSVTTSVSVSGTGSATGSASIGGTATANVSAQSTPTTAHALATRTGGTSGSTQVFCNNFFSAFEPFMSECHSP